MAQLQNTNITGTLSSSGNITVGGNVGIGIPNPVYSLSVNGVIYSAGSVIADGGDVSTSAATSYLFDGDTTTVNAFGDANSVTFCRNASNPTFFIKGNTFVRSGVTCFTSSIVSGAFIGDFVIRGPSNTSLSEGSRAGFRAYYDDASGSTEVRILAGLSNNTGFGSVAGFSYTYGATFYRDATFSGSTTFTSSDTSTSSYNALFLQGSTNNASRFVWGDNNTFAGLAVNFRSGSTSAAFADFQWINRGTGVVQSTPMKIQYAGPNITFNAGLNINGKTYTGDDISLTGSDPYIQFDAGGFRWFTYDAAQSWTPALANATTTITGSGYVDRYGRYTVLGDVILLHFYIKITGRGTLTANTHLRITGLPFIANGFSPTECIIYFASTTNVVIPALLGSIAPGDNKILFYYNGSTINGLDPVNDDILSTNSVFQGSIIYSKVLGKI